MIDAVLVPPLTLLLVMVTGVVEDAEDYADNGWVLWVFVLFGGANVYYDKLRESADGGFPELEFARLAD